MKIVIERGRYEAVATYHERHVLKDAGFQWDKKAKRWVTADVTLAVRVRRYANEQALERIDDELRARADSLEASQAASSSLAVPCPDGLAYRPFQLAGIAYAVDRPGALIADEMGLGKTIEALGLINVDPRIERVLVVCPASVKLNWRLEARRWLVQRKRIGVVNAGDEWPEGCGIVIVNYDILGRYIDAEGRGKKREVTGPAATPWDLVVVDEAHYCKNTKTERSRVVRLVVECSKRTVFLTGTPILNKPVELYNLINMLAPEAWPSWWSYVHRYCGAVRTKFGLDVGGATNLEELETRLRSTVMVRRRKADVLTELPDKIRQIIPIEENEAVPEAVAGVVTAFARAVNRGEDYVDAVRRLRIRDIAAFNELSRVRHETAKKKVPHVVRHVESVLEALEKVVVFGHHHDVLDGIVTGLAAYGPVQIDGRVRAQDRQALVERFQNDPECRVFVGGLEAAGVGITLTAASVVVFAELDWVPATLTQAEDRLHRIGQQYSVLVQHIVADGSVDAMLAETVVRKQEIIDQVIDGGAPARVAGCAE